jgi:hypothetical protein
MQQMLQQDVFLLLPVSNGTAITTTNPSLLLYPQTGSAIMT